MTCKDQYSCYIAYSHGHKIPLIYSQNVLRSSKLALLLGIQSPWLMFLFETMFFEVKGEMPHRKNKRTQDRQFNNDKYL